MSERYPCIVPNFGLHPWFITERTPNWLKTLRGFLESTLAAAVGEIGLDKVMQALPGIKKDGKSFQLASGGSFGRKIDFADEVDVCGQQLQLAKELELLKSAGPVPAGEQGEENVKSQFLRTGSCWRQMLCQN
ncbi:hypothetical protein KY285_010863 [Solanum tuberosum]|nr:hypothetical protein KY289_011433 [Solanum tuberosum]KAH0735156.1 hypothetical protein KY285_010863 [Solanum tuberosum]